MTLPHIWQHFPAIRPIAQAAHAASVAAGDAVGESAGTARGDLETAEKALANIRASVQVPHHLQKKEGCGFLVDSMKISRKSIHFGEIMLRKN